MSMPIQRTVDSSSSPHNAVLGFVGGCEWSPFGSSFWCSPENLGYPERWREREREGARTIGNGRGEASYAYSLLRRPAPRSIQNGRDSGPPG